MSVRKKEPTKQVPKSLGEQRVERSQVQFNLQKIQIDLKCKNESQKNLVKLINENTITICSGRAGTGKTFIACAQALKLLKTEKYKKILLVKSVTELEGESVGFLKGTLEEKFNGIFGKGYVYAKEGEGAYKPVKYNVNSAVDRIKLALDQTADSGEKKMLQSKLKDAKLKDWMESNPRKSSETIEQYARRVPKI